jgi:hypothetical protein
MLDLHELYSKVKNMYEALTFICGEMGFVADGIEQELEEMEAPLVRRPSDAVTHMAQGPPPNPPKPEGGAGAGAGAGASAASPHYGGAPPPRSREGEYYEYHKRARSNAEAPVQMPASTPAPDSVSQWPTYERKSQ